MKILGKIVEMESTDILVQLKLDIAEIKKAILSPLPAKSISEKWVSRSEVMSWLNYGPTQMAALQKSGKLIVTQIGKRKFILRDSIARLLDNNIVT